MQLSHYTKIYQYEEKPGYLLFYSTKKAATILLRETVYKSIGDGSLPLSDKETLSSLGFLVNDVNEEKKSMLHLLDEINSKNTHFNLIVVMNLDCTLSCLYCFEGAMKGKFYMSQETADLLIDFIKSSFVPGKKSFNIDFYGGEPLLSIELIKYISKRLQDLAKDRNIDYTFTLVTNGTLFTRKIAEELASLGLKGVKITLDGTKENHDRYRPFKSGKGSFDKIVKNIKETCEVIKIGIGGNFNRENYKGFPILLEYLLSERLTPEKISNIKFDPIIKAKGDYFPADFRDGCESINEPWLVEAGVILREEILKRGFHTPKITPSPCIIDIRDNFVVNFDGSIYKCPGLIGRKGFEIGDLRTGVKDYRGSYNLDLWKRQGCLDCEYLPLCFGGCRYMKLLRDGNIDGVDCKKQYLDATLEAFIKQDIKYRLKVDKN
jgi:uncharacterized protein